jgi:hypothetical protein
MAARRAASLALRRLASAVAAAPRPAFLVAPLRSHATTTRTLLQPATTASAALYARRGYAARKARAVSEDDEDEFEAMGSDGEFDDDDIEDFDDDEEEEEDEYDAPPKRG